MNTREDSTPARTYESSVAWINDHGPQKRPASVSQINAAQKQVEADAINAKSLALPDAFVCFIPGKNRSRRYTRSCEKSWDVHIWSGQWEFYDIIGNRTAVEDFEEALHVFEVRSCNERRH